MTSYAYSAAAGVVLTSVVVVGLSVVGLSVVGLNVVGLLVVGLNVVGDSVTGSTVVGLSVPDPEPAGHHDPLQAWQFAALSAHQLVSLWARASHQGLRKGAQPHSLM